MTFWTEDTHHLMKIGFTKTQATLYLTLLSLGKTDGKTLSKNANISRPVVYRTLQELQKMGLVEKELAVPYRFSATPLKEGLQIVIDQKLQQYEEKRDKIEEFLLKKQYIKQAHHSEEPEFIIFEGKEKIIQKMKTEHDNVKQSADILTTMKRWLCIVDCCLENYKNALDRKVKYRIVISVEKDSEINLPEKARVLLGYSNIKLKFICKHLTNNFGIFDDSEATFTLHPSKALKETPLIWTNHPGFIAMAKDHFERVWNTT